VAEMAANDLLVVYGLDACDTCRKAGRWLERFGPPFRFVDLHRERPDADMLKIWAESMGGWPALVDRSSSVWAKLLPQRKHPCSDPEWTLLIREHPAILRHPVVALTDGRVAVGFSGGSYERLFGIDKAKP
jgi:Spx/MgsR family transcriptional regulator